MAVAAPNSPWDGYAAGIELRPYQQEAFARFRATSAEPDFDSFYLVAPPGSGKTLLGLLMAEALGRPALSLSPNAAIQQQWLARLRQHWVCLDGAREAFEPQPVGTDRPEGLPSPPALISLTYQRICVRTAAGDYHPNVAELWRLLRDSGVQTLLLDECHHLGGEWGQAVEALCEQLDQVVVVGLTATPTRRTDHRRDAGNGPLGRLFQAPDHAISLPSVVRSGNLAPFQALCHIVGPSSDEEEDVAACLGQFERLFAQLSRSEADRFGISSWCDMLEVESDKYFDTGNLSELLDQQPELVTAWCRQRGAAGYEPPAALPYLPDFFDPATLADRLLLTAHYTARYLLAEHADLPLTRASQAALAEWGFELRQGRVDRRVGRISRLLGFSRQKLRACADILRTELTVMGDDLRVLVLTDYEFPPRKELGLSCVQVLQLLTSSEELDELDPILITGKSLLVDDDLWEHFHQTCERTCAEQGWRLEITREAEQGYWRISGSGPDWNTRVQVTLVTQMLETGLCRCVVSTRALLGEGWDCLRLNTLIDLTVVTSGVAVNQIRGRTIRQDPDNPVKVANNWDVLCLSSLGEQSELDRVTARHAQLYGVTEDGHVERGVGHIHPAFDGATAGELFAQRDQINAAMHRGAAERLAVRQRWRVGQPFADRDSQLLCFTTRARSRRAPSAPTEAATGAREGSGSALMMFPRDHRRARRALALGLGGGAVLTGGLLAAGLALGGPLAWLATAPAAVTALYLRRRSRDLFQRVDSRADLASLAAVLAHAHELDGGTRPGVTLSRREDGSLRVNWQDVDPALGDRLTVALAELIGPVSARRYLLCEGLSLLHGVSFAAQLWRDASTERRAFTVPRMFGRKRQALLLLQAWRLRRDPEAALHHINSSEGAELLQRYRHQRALEGHSVIRTMWY